MVEKRIMKKKLELSVIAILVSPVIFSGCDFPNRPVSRYEIDSRPASHEDAGILIVLNQAIELFHNGHDEKALSLLDDAIEDHPDNVDLYLIQGVIYRRLGMLNQSFGGLGHVIRLDPGNADAYCQRAFVYQQLGGEAWPTDALEDADRAIQLGLNTGLVHIIRGNALFSLQQYDQAIKAFGQAIAVSPESPIAYAGRSRVWLALNETDRAKTDLDQAFRFDPAPEDRAWMIELREVILNLKAGT